MWRLRRSNNGSMSSELRDETLGRCAPVPRTRHSAVSAVRPCKTMSNECKKVTRALSTQPRQNKLDKRRKGKDVPRVLVDILPREHLALPLLTSPT